MTTPQQVLSPSGSSPCNDIADVLLERRYVKKDRSGRILESASDMYMRVALTMAAVEQQYGASSQDVQRWAQIWYELMVSAKFLPNTPTLVNAGKPEGQLSACFVLRIGDSIAEIFETLG